MCLITLNKQVALAHSAGVARLAGSKCNHTRVGIASQWTAPNKRTIILSTTNTKLATKERFLRVNVCVSHRPWTVARFYLLNPNPSNTLPTHLFLHCKENGRSMWSFIASDTTLPIRTHTRMGYGDTQWQHTSLTHQSLFFSCTSLSCKLLVDTSSLTTCPSSCWPSSGITAPSPSSISSTAHRRGNQPRIRRCPVHRHRQLCEICNTSDVGVYHW